MRSCNRFLLALVFLLTPFVECRGDAISDYPILFVTMIPNPRDFGTLAATFGNHVADPASAIRGGDLWIRYPDGTTKNLTAAAGFGNSGFQGSNSIAVRDPAAHWDGTKAIFSMVVGAATQRYQVLNYRWQLYEVTGLRVDDTPVITKLPGQPTAYNNHSPVYGSDDSILFISDRPRDDSVLHTYPQRDEYESSPVNTGLWKLSPTRELSLLDHAPSGDFNPSIDSFGRVIFTRWDHLQRDQQNIGGSLGAFNFQSESGTAKHNHARELFPEPRSVLDPDRRPNVNLHTLNQFFPWMMNQDGTELETLNHIGRQEVGLYSERSYNDDPNVEEFYGQYPTGANQNEFSLFLHIRELQTVAGTYIGTSCQEFGTHSAGQILTINGAPGVNPDAMQVTYLTHPDTAAASASPTGNHTGLYRDPLPLSNGKILVSHTANTREDQNIGTSVAPLSRYDFRIKLLTPGSPYSTPGAPLTAGISKSITYWSPDESRSYSGTLWEMMPVEVKSRPRPTPHSQTLPSAEGAVLSRLGVSMSELQEFLRAQSLALVISRDITMRDRNDRQQPTNLRVANGGVESVPNPGKVYEVSGVQFFQGDLIRGYSNSSGRRVLPQPMHSVPEGLNLAASDESTVEIAEDGSVAAFVPASRALTWQLTTPNGEGVVKERYWVTFQPGEVRVCTSCHGINTSDHAGRVAPVNEPIALHRLLAKWKDLPVPPRENYSLRLTGSRKALGSFRLSVSGSGALRISAQIGNTRCRETHPVTKTIIKGRFPHLSGRRITFSLMSNQRVVANAVAALPRSPRGGTRTRESCRQLFQNLR